MLALIAVSVLIGNGARWQAKPVAPKKLAQAPKSQLRQLLDAPVYYLGYHMNITAEGAGAGEMYGLPASGHRRIVRDVHGMVTLALHSAGPSLSMADVMTPGYDSEAMVRDWANWTSGAPPPDEPQTDANFMKYGKQWIYNYRGSMIDTGEHHYQEPLSESDEHATVDEVWSFSGQGPVACAAVMPVLEINGPAKKFKALVPLSFSDTQSDTARGTSTQTRTVRGQSTTETKTDPRQLWADGDFKITDPNPNQFIEGPLPAKGLAINGIATYSVNVDGVSGTMTVDITLTPTPPEEVELIVEPPKDYADWRPKAGDDESVPGNKITVTAHLQKLGGGQPKLKKVNKFEYKLLYTSNEKGVCMNWPLVADASLPLDLKIENSENPKLITDAKGQSATDPTQPYDGKVTVTSFDYGATAELQVVAYLDNGEKVIGKVKGTSDETLYLPKRAKANGFIALSFLKKHGVESLSDNDDAENKPEGNGFNGDGLTLYEEYRGFKVGGNWMTANPKKKELFLVNTMKSEPHTWKGINIYRAATRITVHSKLLEAEVDGNHVINFNHTMRPHVVEQHALFIVRGKMLKEGEHAARVRKVGPPGVAIDVSMPPDWTKWLRSTRGWQPDYAITIAHEMTHGASVNHHGQVDKGGLVWRVVDAPTPHWEEQKGRWDTRIGNWDFVGSATTVVLKKEDGSTYAATSGRYFLNVWLANPGGQHSGDNECIMKYNCATGYPSGGEANVRYVTCDEYAGVVLCADAKGTGVNDPSRSLPVGHPQSRQGPADKGDCQHQLCINDLFSLSSSPTSMSNTSTLVASKPSPRLPVQEDVQATVDKVAPSIVVGANDVTEQSLKAGWPLIVSATLIGSDGTASAIPAGMTPQLTDLSGKPVSLSFEPLISDADKTQSYWLAKEGATSNLAAGTYRITLAGGAAQDIAPSEIKVKTGDELTEGDRSLLTIQLLLIAGKADDALVETNKILANNPGNIMALIAQGDILMSKGDAPGGLKAYSQAEGYFETAESQNEAQGDTLSENMPLYLRLRDAMKAAFDALPSQ